PRAVLCEYAIATLLLGFVQRPVRLLQELFGRDRVRPARERHSDRDSDCHRRARWSEREVIHAPPETLRKRQRALPSGVRKKDHELVATEPRDSVRVACRSLHDAGQLLKDNVADGMSAGVIDLLEMIQIDRGQRDVSGAALCLTPVSIQTRLERVAVYAGCLRIVPHL